MERHAWEKLPRNGPTAEILAVLKGFVDGIIGDPGVSLFRIGRTDDLAVTRDALGCGHLFPLYAAGQAGGATEMVDSLAGAFRGHPRYDGRPVPAGEEPLEGGCGFVYLAVWTFPASRTAC